MSSRHTNTRSRSRSRVQVPAVVRSTLKAIARLERDMSLGLDLWDMMPVAWQVRDVGLVWSNNEQCWYRARRVDLWAESGHKVTAKHVVAGGTCLTFRPLVWLEVRPTASNTEPRYQHSFRLSSKVLRRRLGWHCI